MSIRFGVIDTTCEQADQSFYVPQIRMTTKSTTQNAVLHGYSEFIASTPPKKYRKATLSGVSERVGFTCEQTPRMCAGANYTWSGSGEYDLKGIQISSYSKKFFAQCPKQFWPLVPLQLNPSAIPPSTDQVPTFVGYCWPDDPESCSTCPPDIIDWPLIGDQTTNVLQQDLKGFLLPANNPVVTATSWTATGQVTGFFGLNTLPHQTTGNGNFYNVTVGADTFAAEGATTDPVLNFPVVYMSGIPTPPGPGPLFEGAYVNFADASNYSAVLSEEYTDADALANAQVITGTGNTASTQPRTTGFVSVFTTVVFTMLCSNLVPGKDYLVTVDLWDQSKSPVSSHHTTKQYGFTADSDTHSILDTVPTPAANHTITVSKPTIAYSTP